MLFFYTKQEVRDYGAIRILYIELLKEKMLNKMTDETVFGFSSIDISLVGLAISLFSLLVASYLAWKTKFSPPKLVGSVPYVVIWKFETNNEKNPEDIYIVPFVWLSNIGARPMLIEDIRLSIHFNDETKYFLDPIHSVPITAIEQPNIFSDFELIRLGEAPFCGLSIANSEQWKNTYAFSISSKKKALLKGNLKLVLEMSELGSSKFKSVISENINFDNREFDWAVWADLDGPGSEYYYKVK